MQYPSRMRHILTVAWIIWLAGACSGLYCIVIFDHFLNRMSIGLTLSGLLIWLGVQITSRYQTPNDQVRPFRWRWRSFSILVIGAGLALAGYQPVCVAPQNTSMPHFPIYPGAQDVCFFYQQTRSVFGPGGHLEFQTSDSPAQVIAFYQPNFPQARITQHPTEWLLEDRQRPDWQRKDASVSHIETQSFQISYLPPLSSVYWTTAIRAKLEASGMTKVEVKQNVVFCGYPDGCPDQGPDRSF